MHAIGGYLRPWDALTVTEDIVCAKEDPLGNDTRVDSRTSNVHLGWCLRSERGESSLILSEPAIAVALAGNDKGLYRTLKLVRRVNY